MLAEGVEVARRKEGCTRTPACVSGIRGALDCVSWEGIGWACARRREVRGGISLDALLAIAGADESTVSGAQRSGSPGIILEQVEGCSSATGFSFQYGIQFSRGKCFVECNGEELGASAEHKHYWMLF